MSNYSDISIWTAWRLHPPHIYEPRAEMHTAFAHPIISFSLLQCKQECYTYLEGRFHLSPIATISGYTSIYRSQSMRRSEKIYARPRRSKKATAYYQCCTALSRMH